VQFKWKGKFFSKSAKEKASTTVINVVSGTATAKQIEREFMDLVGSDVWMLTARQVAENTFTMRFPNARMVRDWGHF
jgi:hypothetical protein